MIFDCICPLCQEWFVYTHIHTHTHTYTFFTAFTPDSFDKLTAHFLNKRILISNNSNCQVFSEQYASRCDKEILSIISLCEAGAVDWGVGPRSFDYRVVISELCCLGWVSSSIMHFCFAEFITSSAVTSLKSKST